MKKLKIAMMVAGQFAIPQPKDIVYAPMDIATYISEEMVKRGHRVDFFAPKGSRVKASRIITGNLPPLSKVVGKFEKNADFSKIFSLWDQYLIALMFKLAKKEKYDLLHIHPVDRALPLALSHPELPVVYTLHDPISPWRAQIFKMFSSKNQYYVPISNAQKKPAPKLNYLKTIYNGIKLEEFPFSGKRGKYLLFVGRIMKEKGVAEAVRIARDLNEKLLIIGPTSKDDYWKKGIEPYLGKNIKYIGYVPRKKLFYYYKNAKAFLFPLQWEEPFGLTMTEAMACGTPVIAFNRGSVPEIVENGKTGFIVKDFKEMASAIKNIDSIDRQNCRTSVENKFSFKTMADNYEKEFIKIVFKK
ncbi:MAG: glycosyltransferase family 4 protein [Patescibacteria group bacterium]|nr:glycosyltransferase family 4 protein [Patescibacteria group bacterium]